MNDERQWGQLNITHSQMLTCFHGRTGTHSQTHWLHVTTMCSQIIHSLFQHWQQAFFLVNTALSSCGSHCTSLLLGDNSRWDSSQSPSLLSSHQDYCILKTAVYHLLLLRLHIWLLIGSFSYIKFFVKTVKKKTCKIPKIFHLWYTINLYRNASIKCYLLNCLWQETVQN